MKKVQAEIKQKLIPYYKKVMNLEDVYPTIFNFMHNEVNRQSYTTVGSVIRGQLRININGW